MQRGTSDTRNPRMRGQRRGGGGPTVADVARAAGVSPMTVSRVVNREANVLPATRDKVTAAIAALGYVPNRAARSLAGGQQCRIALLHNNPSATYLSALLMGALDGVRAAEAELIVEQHATGDSFETLVARLSAFAVVGSQRNAYRGDDRGRRERVVYEPRCRTVDSSRYEQRIEGYDVTYRYNGQTYTTQMAYDPGTRLPVRVDVSPLRY